MAMGGLRVLAAVAVVAMCCHQAAYGEALAAPRAGGDVPQEVVLLEEMQEMPQWGAKEAALTASPNATLDAVLGNLTIAPLYAKDTKVINFDRALRMAIAGSTGTSMTWTNVELLAVRPNTMLTPKEFRAMTGDVGAINSNETFAVIPTVQILFKVQTTVKGAPLEEAAKTLANNVETGQLLKDLQGQLKTIGVGVKRFESELVLYKKELQFVTPKTKQDKIKFPAIKNVTLAGCKKQSKAAILDTRNVGPLGWKNYSKPPLSNMTFKGPFTAQQTMANDTMAKLDFTSGQLLVKMKFQTGAGTPGGTLLYLGGNATCMGLAVFVKGTSLGIGNTCSSGMETLADLGIASNKNYEIKLSYRWGKVEMYLGDKLKKKTVKHFVLPRDGKITIGAGGHDNGQGKFKFGKINDVMIKNEAAEFVAETPVQQVYYNCSDIPCRGVWVAKKNTCAPVGYCDEDIPCPEKSATNVIRPAAVPVTRRDTTMLFEEEDLLQDLGGEVDDAAWNVGDYL